MSKAIILGNGPSRDMLETMVIDKWIPIFGCNFPHIKTSCIVINDSSAVKKLAEGKKELEIPLILSERAHSQFKKMGLSAKIMSTYKQRPYYSSGHQAALKAIEFGHTHLILCGFDVLFEDTTYSRTDEIFPKKNKDSSDRNCIREWRKKWESIASKEGVLLEVLVPQDKKNVVPGIEHYTKTTID